MMDHGRDSLQQQAAHYDIREVPEALYLAVLARYRAESDRSAADLG